MKKASRQFLSLALAFLLLWAITPGASANSAEPPCFTVVVNNAPEDLELSVEYADGNAYDLLELASPERKAWESYYRFFHIHYEQKDLQKNVLRVKYGSENFTCAFPPECSNYHNGLLFLDLQSHSLNMKFSRVRSALLVFLRVLLTLLIEGFVLYLFRYRSKRSWIIFLVTNLITQFCLNCLFLMGMSSGQFGSLIVVYLYAIGEIFVFLTEALVFAMGFREHSKGRAFLYALTANAASLIIGGACLAFLPF